MAALALLADIRDYNKTHDPTRVANLYLFAFDIMIALTEKHTNTHDTRPPHYDRQVAAMRSGLRGRGRGVRADAKTSPLQCKRSRTCALRRMWVKYLLYMNIWTNGFQCARAFNQG